MAEIALRACLNAISDVVHNRPRPLREFDQIFMKTADMLLQTEHVSRLCEGKRVVFIGDGDAIGLCLVHLHNMRLPERGPKSVHVLDFDERVVFSIRAFAERFGLSPKISAELYNVVDPLLSEHWERFECFYTNPPFGASNHGQSVEAFLRRGMEAVGSNAIGCLVLADDPSSLWTRAARLLVQSGFMISELLPEFHHYHLDDAPELTSCSMVVHRTVGPGTRSLRGSRSSGQNMRWFWTPYSPVQSTLRLHNMSWESGRAAGRMPLRIYKAALIRDVLYVDLDRALLRHRSAQGA
jgi:predicted methyltransferase